MTNARKISTQSRIHSLAPICFKITSHRIVICQRQCNWRQPNPESYIQAVWGSDMCGSNIDDSSKLLIGSIQTNPKARIDLFQRPFATVPYLGRGAVDPILESQIQQGEAVTNKRTVTRLTEKSHLRYRTTPLIPEMQQTVQNPDNIIEANASQGWIRGGVPSRELSRDRDMYTKQ